MTPTPRQSPQTDSLTDTGERRAIVDEVEARMRQRERERTYSQECPI